MPTTVDTSTAILQAALPTFARFGYRKTSMDDVARAAGLSRQALYLHFESKEQLFRGAATLLFETSLEGAKLALGDADRPLEDRLVAAFDAWHGDSLDLMHAGGHADELIARGHELLGEMELAFHERFVRSLAAALRGSARGLARARVSERDVAEMLTATSKGLKHMARSRAEYRQGMRTAARLVAAPAPR